jgi:hydrogenase nickel incorporation protein HypB
MMCTICGCGNEGDHSPTGADLHHHDHAHGHHDHVHLSEGVIDFGAGLARAHAPGMSQGRMLQIERDILGKNDAYAEVNRARLKAAGVFALNLVSSPGSGKTTLLTRTITDLQPFLPIAVIEGDQQTSNDAARIRATGAPALQINTGKGFHLDAAMVGEAYDRLPPLNIDLLFIENVGNLVCPAGFDLGEAHKVVVLSTTEGEDKPLKYPDMFYAADLMLLNKTDLLPHLDFSVAQARGHAERVHPGIACLTLSARTGEGFAGWLDWLRQGVRAAARPKMAFAEGS